ncbi:MAG: hypothetical protein JXJ20_02025 [Anaerolineae bacterium]|nr:hypothetical protein [Anaerolineae bacterium]
MATFRVDIDWDGDGSFEDGEIETARVLSMYIWRGFAQPGDPVAAVGRCRLVLDNSDQRFSPGCSGGDLYGDLLPRRKVFVRETGGAENAQLFSGWIERIVPGAGGLGRREVVIECVDGIALLAGARVDVAHEDSKDVDAALTALANLAYSVGHDFTDNGDALEHYGRTWTPEHTTVVQAVGEVCRAVYGRFFIAGNGVMIYRARGDFQDASASAALALNNHPVDDLVMQIGIETVVNQAQVKIYPVETIGTAQVLWQSHVSYKIEPGESRVIYANYHDDAGERCGAVNVVTPVAGTDYEVNEYSNGSGFNYTYSSSFDIDVEKEATRTRITLSSTAIGPLYVTKLQVRGKPVITYDPIVIEEEDTGSQGSYQVRQRVFDLPMQSDLAFGQALAGYVIGRYKEPFLYADRVVIRNRDVINGVRLWNLGILDKIEVSDEQTGANALGHWIRAVEYRASAQGFEIVLHLERADDTQYWLLGVNGYGALGSQTRLGF